METYFDKKCHTSFVNGVFVKPSGKAKPHISPVTQKAWTSIEDATSEHIEKALSSLELSLSPYERSEYLHAMADYLIENKEAIAKIITLEMGKVITDANREVDYAVGYFRWFAEEAKRIYSLNIPSHFPNKHCSTCFVPIGPCFIMTPWNFPLAMGTRKIGPAIAAGCPVIARPSSHTPLSLLVLGAAAQRIGLPKSALHILLGSSEAIANPLMQSPVIKKFSFTGSTEIGKKLYEMGAPSLKKASLELGGNAPLIVFDDAKLDLAVEGAALAKFRINGQTCICANRIFVQKSIYETFIERFTSHVKRFYIADPFDEKAQISPVLHPASQDKVQQHKADALEKGARPVLVENEPYKPQILADVTPDMRIFREETFGPLAGIIPFESDDEALKLANQTIHGLAAYVFTQNLSRCQKSIDALDFGIIGINDGRPSAAELPFGGLKASGFGKEGGPKGIYEYLNEKVISLCTT